MDFPRAKRALLLTDEQIALQLAFPMKACTRCARLGLRNSRERLGLGPIAPPLVLPATACLAAGASFVVGPEPAHGSTLAASHCVALHRP